MVSRPASLPRRGEWRRATAIAVVLIASAFIQGICDVLATSAVAVQGGNKGIVALWAVDAGIALLGIGSLTAWVDRTDRRSLGIWMLGVFALCYLGVWSQTRGDDPHPMWWGTLGVVDTLQSNLVVLTAWALARDLFDETEAMRLFGLMGGLAYVGTLAGTGLTALVAKGSGGSAWLARVAHMLGLGPDALRLLMDDVDAWLLPLCALVALGTAACLAWLVPQIHTQTPQEREAEPPAPIRYLWQEPTLRGLCGVVTGNAICWTMMSLAVLVGLQSGDASDVGLQRTYGQMRFVGPLAHAVVQALFSGWLLRKFGYGRLFLATPVVLFLNLVMLGVSPSVATAWAASLFIQFVFGAEGAAAHALLVRVPVDLRGRVGAWVTGTLPQLGYLVACVLLFTCDAITGWLHWSARAGLILFVSVAATIACVNVATGVWLRRAFDQDPHSSAA